MLLSHLTRLVIARISGLFLYGFASCESNGLIPDFISMLASTRYFRHVVRLQHKHCLYTLRVKTTSSVDSRCFSNEHSLTSYPHSSVLFLYFWKKTEEKWHRFFIGQMPSCHTIKALKKPKVMTLNQWHGFILPLATT